MANLKEIRTRLNSVKSTRQITSAMKMVSAAKLRRAQDSILQLRPFYNKLHEILLHVNDQAEDMPHNIYAQSKEKSRILLVVITSNRGLCGAFNSNIVKATIQIINEQYAAEYKSGLVDIIAIGKKGMDQLKTKKLSVLTNYNHLFDQLLFNNISELSENIMADFAAGKYHEVKLLYNQFRNAAVQDVTEELFLPFRHEHTDELSEIPPVDYILEPSVEDIVTKMIPYFLRLRFFRALLESFASEHGARMTAMHKATDNATELIKELGLKYNKARQAAITNEILEIIGGADALKG